MALLDEAIVQSPRGSTGASAVIDRGSATSRGTVDGDRAGSVFLVDGFVWLATIDLESPTGHLLKVDPLTLAVVGSMEVTPSAFITGYGFDSLWQFSWDAGAVIRLPTESLTRPSE